MTNIFLKDPSAVLDFIWDWQNWLAAGESIQSYTVSAPSGITKVSDSSNGTAITMWLSGGTAGRSYAFVNQVTTTAGRTDERTMTVKVVNR